MIVPSKDLPVVVIGAGPVGLAAAAHLAERGIDFVVLEAGSTAAAAIEEWRHVRLFSPWRYDIDSAARRLLEGIEWTEPDLGALPTGGDLIEAGELGDMRSRVDNVGVCAGFLGDGLHR